MWESGGDVLAQNYDEYSLDYEVKIGLKILLLFKLMNILSFQSRCETEWISHIDFKDNETWDPSSAF